MRKFLIVLSLLLAGCTTIAQVDNQSATDAYYRGYASAVIGLELRAVDITEFVPVVNPKTPAIPTPPASPPGAAPDSAVVTPPAVPEEPPAAPAAKLPMGDDYASTYKRAQLTGNKLLVLLGATWCGPCVDLHNNHLSELRRCGELALIDIDRESVLAGQLAGAVPAVPRLLVYDTECNGFKKLDDLLSEDSILKWARLAAPVPAQAKAPIAPPAQAAAPKAECCPGGKCDATVPARTIFKGRFK